MKLFPIALSIIAFAVGSQAFAAPQSYPLVCRGNANGFSYSSASKVLKMSFIRGTGPSSNGVAPSTCTWIDRGLSANEPNKICHYGVELTTLWFANAGITSISSPQAPYVSTARGTNQTFIVQVYNDGQGCMRVTRVGP